MIIYICKQVPTIGETAMWYERERQCNNVQTQMWYVTECLRDVSERECTSSTTMPDKNTTETICIVRQVQEMVLGDNNKTYWAFVDLEKAFDHVTIEVVYLSLRERGIS